MGQPLKPVGAHAAGLAPAATGIKVGFDDNASANHIAYKAKNFIVLCIHSIIMILYNLEVNHTTISGAQNNKGQQNPLSIYFFSSETMKELFKDYLVFLNTLTPGTNFESNRNKIIAQAINLVKP
ncbi:hypothetical protein ACLB1T_31610 [Escherichia coli]